MRTDLIWDSYWGEGDISNITDFEKRLGVMFPQEYKNIVEKYNGAYIENKDVFSVYSNLVERKEVYEVGMFLPFGEIEDTNETMEVKAKIPPDEFCDGLVIFSAMGGGDFLCFDYRNCSGSNPPVVIWHHQGRSGSVEEISDVALSFCDFLDILFEE